MTLQSTIRLYDRFDQAPILRAIEDGLVSVKVNEYNNLHLLNYTERAQFTRSWSPEVMACRGLIISGHPSDENVTIVMTSPTTCACAPDGPFCGACLYDEDGELIEAHAHQPHRVRFFEFAFVDYPPDPHTGIIIKEGE